MIWTVCDGQEIMNTEVTNFAKALNGEYTILLMTENSKNIEVCFEFETIADLLIDHYPSSDMDLKQQKDDKNRRSPPMYQHAKSI
jgi:hypothetical protein